MTDYPKSKWLLSLFASPTKSGGTYYSTTYKGAAPLVIMPGTRLSLVKSAKTASNGSEIWNLLADEAGTIDENRVHESTANYADRGPAPANQRGFLDDEIPF